jgi:PAP2 superfamily
MAAAANHRFWIDVSLECVRRDHTGPIEKGAPTQRGPFRTARALGMALAAPNEVHAQAAGTPSLLGLASVPGLAGLTGPALEVAACAACVELLTLRYPRQADLLEADWLLWRTNNGHGANHAAEEALGRTVGMAIHALGAADADHAAGDMYSPSGLPYTHEAPPTEPAQGFAGADWGGAARLLTTHVAGFPPPPGRVSATEMTAHAHYQADFARVVDKGSINSTSRTAEEEFVGIAWGYDGPPKLGTPPRLYMQAVLSVLDRLTQAPARAPRLTLAEELEIIAGVGLAMAEAGIDAWYYKYAPTHMMWRPAVGVRKANAAHGTMPDPDFLPLGRPDTNKRGLALTPDFPAYPSGHATFGAAAFELLRLYLAEKGLAKFDGDGVDDVALNFVSDEYNGINTDPRTLKPRPARPVTTPSLWRAIVDNSISRVYLGVHWQFDGLSERNAAGTDVFAKSPGNLTPDRLGSTGGVWLGRQIAKQVATRLGVAAAVIAGAK